MNDHLNTNEHLAHGTLAMWREDIAQNAAAAAVHAQLAVTYAEIGDDAGMSYALKCLVACVRAAIGSLNNLREDKRRTAGPHEGI